MKPAPENINEAGIVHPGLIFLLRAAVRFDLVEKGEMNVPRALAELEDAINNLYPVEPCRACGQRHTERLERLYPLPAKRQAA